MRLSIVIVNWNTSELLDACLRSIRNFPPNGDYEVIVVDNASDDFDEHAFRAEFPQVQLIRNAENSGYARGNNQGWGESSGDYVLLLNPDTELTDGALNKLVEFMDAHERAAAAGAKLIRPDGTIDRSVRLFPYPRPIAWEFLGLSKLFPNSRRFGSYRMTTFAYDRVAEVDQPMGSALILRRKAMQEVGPMDEAFPIFFNEVDWLYRAKTAGWLIYFTPDATIIHHGGGSTTQVKRRAMVRESHLSLLRFYAKHFQGRISAPTYYFTVACIRLSLFVRG